MIKNAYNINIIINNRTQYKIEKKNGKYNVYNILCI